MKVTVLDLLLLTCLHIQHLHMQEQHCGHINYTVHTKYLFYWLYIKLCDKRHTHYRCLLVKVTVYSFWIPSGNWYLMNQWVVLLYEFFIYVFWQFLSQCLECVETTDHWYEQ